MDELVDKIITEAVQNYMRGMRLNEKVITLAMIKSAENLGLTLREYELNIPECQMINSISVYELKQILKKVYENPPKVEREDY